MKAVRRLASGPSGGVAAAAAVLVIAAGLLWLRWSAPGRQAMPDTYWYARQAVIYTGVSVNQADKVASRLECASRNQYAHELGKPPACHHYPSATPNPRYVRIFTTRPGFSLLAAPLVALGGAWHGMEQATAVAAFLAVLLGYAAVRTLGGSRLAGIASAVLLALLPTGYWITRMLPEGAMLAGCLAAGIGITLMWPGPAGARTVDGTAVDGSKVDAGAPDASTVSGGSFGGGTVDGSTVSGGAPGPTPDGPTPDGPTPDGPTPDGGAAAPGRARIAAATTLAASGLLWTYVVKSANGFLLSAVLLAGGALLAAWTWRRAPRAAGRPMAAVMAALGLAGTVGWLAVSREARLPSFTETIQDMASSHFRGRLTPSPVGYLVGRDLWFIPHWCLVLVNDVWPLPVVAAGIGGLIWASRDRAIPWLLIGVTGPLAVAAHPIGSESDRLSLPVWLPVIAGLALGADRAGRRAIRRWITGRGRFPDGDRLRDGRPDGWHPSGQPGEPSVAWRSPSGPPPDSISSASARS